MATSEIDQIGSVKAFVDSEKKRACKEIKEFDDGAVSEWCVERGLFTERAIGGYGLAMSVVAARIDEAIKSKQ